ncbi:MAG: cyclic nucleotide-binding domain-containing protein [Deltaproteobacteria bacterium]|nr:cyclic nucleotide-binding domain-containing protein [Deltaproteobacteria bacterium]
MVREIEFEFRDDSDGGRFLACGNVMGTLRDYINRGDIDAAARLYASCTESVGEDLVADLQAGASAAATLNAAKVFAAARDFRRAAICAEQAGDHANAARLFEADYDFAKAAALYAQTGNLPKAAELFEKSGAFAKAGETYFKLNEPLRAAECFERAQSFLNAGKLFAKAKRWDKAVELLQRVTPTTPGHSEACDLVKKIVERRLAPATAAAAPTSASAIAATTAATPATRGPAPLNLAGPAAAPAARLIGIDPHFEFLKGLPLFAELSLDELRQIHTAAERIRFQAGATLIKQGLPGTALYILTQGKVRVSTKDAAGNDVVLVELGPGQYVGEMALIDDAPTSANVTAVVDTHAFKLGRDRFRELLTTQDRIALRFYRTFVGDLVGRLRDTNRKLQQQGS